MYVSLLPGDEQEGYCAIWLKTMYGTEDASHVWQEDYSQHLKQRGFIQGRAWTSVFRHATKNIQLLVHGDDFLVLADQAGQDYMKEELSKKLYEHQVG